MSTLSIHAMEYLRLHLHYEDVRSGLRASLGSFFAKACAPVERAATVAVVCWIPAVSPAIVTPTG